MTNKEIFQTALRQSAVDLSCSVEDLLSDKNKIVISKPNSGARKYLELPFDCNLVYYGRNIVASVRSGLEELIDGYINSYPAEHCFETPNMHVLNSALSKHGLGICFMAEYFLPDMENLKKLSCKFQTRILEHHDFKDLYTPEWSNALCEKRKELDVLGIGAYDNGKLIGLAACSADCDTMYQIGVDVLPSYRRNGIACALTSALATEIIKLGKVPFYCAAWSNIGSVRNAIKSGFRPAWAEMTAKSTDTINKMNKR